MSEVGIMLRRGAPKLDENGKPMRDAHGKVIYEPYRIKVLNTINFKKSMKYNPFANIRNEKDILKLVNVIIANTKGDGEKSSEDFWVKAERLLYCALIGYIWYEAEPEEKNFLTLLELINASEAREDDEEFQSPVDILFAKLEKEHPDHFAVKQYRKFKLAAGKTLKSILISCGARLAPFDIAELREIMSDDELELDALGDRKTALFLIMSDTDTTFNFVIAMLFEKQYILTQTVEVEVRYRTETRTDSDGNDYDVEVPYNYYICKAKLENFDFSNVPVYIMDEETLSLYAVYMATLGNREDLFPGSGYVDKYTKPPTTYDIPPSALEDETFAALITEAEKYIGYPYVWGGSNPNTSFDCSGFVSWALTQSGVCNTGRLGAQGLYNISTLVSDPQPGDLVFFVGTYDTSGVSHVGIYVGDGMMLQCGDPIQYSNLNTSYWQSHFYAYGRPPYN